MTREIISSQHPLVKHFVRLRQNHDYRDEHGSVIIEGMKMVSEVCTSHHTKVILTCDINAIPANVKADEVIVVSEAVMDKVSGVQNPEGIIAEVATPKQASLKGCKRVIACDGINDPGNLGTILRTALALGWEGAYILNNSCDPYNDKALRAGKGATFRLPLARGSWNDLKGLIKDNQWQPVAADVHGIDIREFPRLDKILLLLSSEAQGVSEEAASFKKVKIPMPGEMESLNVAAAATICMYVLRSHE